VVTSRPSASACLHDIVDSRIEILGFDQNSRKKYVDESLKDNPSKKEKLQQHFQLYPNIDAICYIPLLMSIIVLLCMFESDDLPPTATKMYHSFIFHTICHYLKRMGMVAEDELINSMIQLPQMVSKVLEQLQKVAFDGLLQDKIVFTIDDLPDMCRKDPTCCGLLQSVEFYSLDKIGTVKSFNFLHLGIQEYFAAKYVATLQVEEVYTLLKESFLVDYHNGKSVRLSNMWVMYCGITSGQCSSLRSYLSNDPYDDDVNKDLIDNVLHHTRTSLCNDNLLHQQIISTSTPLSTTPVMSHWSNPPLKLSIGSPSLTPPIQPLMSPITPAKCQHITSYLQPLECHSICNTPHQQQPLGCNYHSVLSSNNPTNGDHIISSQLQVTSGKMTAPSPQISSSESLTISQDILNDHRKVLYLFQCFQEAQDDKLCEILSKSLASGEIDLQEAELLPHEISSLGFFLSKSQRKWNLLDLSGCGMEDHNVYILHHYLCGNKDTNLEVKEIQLGGNEFTGASSPVIGDIVTHLQPQILGISVNNYCISMEEIFTAIIKSNSVKVVDMDIISLTVEELSIFCNMLNYLEKLSFYCYDLDSNKATILAEEIVKSNTLRDLYIVEESETIAKAIADNLLHTSLESLELPRNKIGTDRATAIANAIANSKTLKKLNIASNNIGTTGAIAIANSLKHNHTVKVLDISYNDIGEDGFITISEAITNNHSSNLVYPGMEISSSANNVMHNTSLEILNMSGNSISDSGAAAIGRAIAYNNTLKQLIIRGTKLTGEGATAIASSFAHNTSLEILDMCYNSIGEDGTIAIGVAVTTNNALKYLNIGSNNVTPTIIANMLSHNTSLEVLDISGNDIGDDGVTAIARAITLNKALKKLKMGSHKITVVGSTTIFNSLKYNTSLEVLVLTVNNLSKSVATTIAQTITINNTLKELHFHWRSNFVISPEDEVSVITIIKSLHCNNSITKLILPSSIYKIESHRLQKEIRDINSIRQKCNIPNLTW